MKYQILFSFEKIRKISHAELAQIVVKDNKTFTRFLLLVLCMTTLKPKSLKLISLITT